MRLKLWFLIAIFSPIFTGNSKKSKIFTNQDLTIKVPPLSVAPLVVDSVVPDGPLGWIRSVFPVGDEDVPADALSMPVHSAPKLSAAVPAEAPGDLLPGFHPQTLLRADFVVGRGAPHVRVVFALVVDLHQPGLRLLDHVDDSAQNRRPDAHHSPAEALRRSQLSCDQQNRCYSIFVIHHGVVLERDVR